MKKYLVSFALKVPCNFEVGVDANSEKEAFKKAMKEWNNKSDFESVTDPIWEELELDINMKEKLGTLENGIYIQEIEK